MVPKIWGHERWAISSLPEGPSLSNEKPIGEIPYLLKIIETSQKLSVQVHPHDEYARLHENSSGKAECWLILNAAPDARIYLGLKKDIDKTAFINHLDNNTIEKALMHYPVKRGDFFFVPPGTVHAIGANITLMELQQNSGITYRMWDWGRGRELHFQKCMDVINFKNNPQSFQMQNNLLDQLGRKTLVKHPDFSGELIHSHGNESLKVDRRHASLIILEGSVSINDTVLNPLDACLLSQGTYTVLGGQPWTCVYSY